jgi:phage-related protein
MPGWLAGLIGFFSGAFRELWNAVINVIRTLDGYLERRINAVQTQVNALIAGEWHLSFFISDFISGPFASFVKWTQVRTATIITYFDGKYNDLARNINDIRSWVPGLVAAAEALARSLFGQLLKWVIDTIFGPLSRDIAKALGWIFKEGAWILDVLTHPEKLIALVLHYLFGAWVTFAIRYGPVMVSYGLRHWKTLLPTLLNIIENIIDHAL